MRTCFRIFSLYLSCTQDRVPGWVFHPLLRWSITGRAAVVVQDAEAYYQLLERVETIEALHRGFADVSAGRTTLARVALNRLGRKHGIPR